ncbi:MAG: redoxin domain-containing protein, partial [Intestinibacter sp.]
FMGFTFSFAWTPCIGPALASVLMLASNSQSILQGNLLVLLYTIGFAIPFLLLGLFTTQVLNFFKNKQKIVQYTIKISAVILIIVGILTLSGGIEKITTFFTQLGNNMVQNSQNSQENNSIISGTETQTEDQSESNNNSIPAIDFTLTDQYGKEHNLSDYKGKVIFLNFWTTWCTYCKQELPELEELYQKYGKNEEDVVFLGITSPSNEQNPYAQDIGQSQIKEFISQNNLTFPMLFDITGEVYNKYYIYSFPTSFLINQKGEVEWYSPGMLPKEQIESEIIRLLEK